jgi:Pyridoxamine 5'-phosphate oxidase
VNSQEIAAYLDAPYIAVVATIGRNGAPHLTPNWYRYDGQMLTLITRTDRLEYLNLDTGAHRDTSGWETVGLRVAWSRLRGGNMKLAQLQTAPARTCATDPRKSR